MRQNSKDHSAPTFNYLDITKEEFLRRIVKPAGEDGCWHLDVPMGSIVRVYFAGEEGGNGAWKGGPHRIAYRIATGIDALPSTQIISCVKGGHECCNDKHLIKKIDPSPGRLAYAAKQDALYRKIHMQGVLEGVQQATIKEPSRAAVPDDKRICAVLDYLDEREAEGRTPSVGHIRKLLSGAYF
jgi:hypothetical protein